MATLEIAGGARLKGEIEVSGAKNSILPIMAASLLSPEPCCLQEIPQLTDVRMMQEVLQFVGAKVSLSGRNLWLDGAEVVPQEVPPSLMRRLRASNLVMGSLLGRFRQVRVAYPGGCAIGSRPMDLHLKGFLALGAEIREDHGFIEARAARLRGADIHLDFPSVGATENIMMAAVLAEGVTTIRNAAKEPEIVDLQNFLNRLGARVKGAGSDVIRVHGVPRLRGGEYQVIPDRIEAGTHLVAAAITRGRVVVKNVIPEHLEALIAKLREAGVRVETLGGRSALLVEAEGRVRGVDCKTLPYPGFPTDMQPQMMALLATAEGTSVITESIFESRFKHVDELRRMGAQIKVEGRVAVVNGVPRLSGALVEATDLRAAAALVLAGLVAENTTVLEGVEHLDRGYECLDLKYEALGAQIRREAARKAAGSMRGT
ncbi:MAG: UDP-N-acetylglucosamine 1-carboxyvinyltransferase [Clostridia bacterium]|nr:UDP-N-acetylglucosamine 1-carboxyvinyltransferase [Clostridia bacterium]